MGAKINKKLILIILFIIGLSGFVNAESLRAMFVADMHFGQTGGDPPTNHTFISESAEKMNDLDLDIVSILGDITGNKSPEQYAYFQTYLLNQLKVPVWIEGGDHDFSGAGRTPVPDAYDRYKNETSQPLYYSLTLKGIHFIFVPDIGEAAYTEDEILEWIKYDLSKNTDKTVVIVSQEPIYNTTNTTFGEPTKIRRYWSRREEWDNILDNNPNIKVFLNAHNHVNDIKQIDGRLHVACGKLGGFNDINRTGVLLEINANEIIIKTYDFEINKYRSPNGSLNVPTSFNKSEKPIFAYGSGIEQNNMSLSLHNHFFAEKRILEITGQNHTNLIQNYDFKVITRYVLTNLNRLQPYWKLMLDGNSTWEHINSGGEYSIRIIKKDNISVSTVCNPQTNYKGRHYSIAPDTDYLVTANAYSNVVYPCAGIQINAFNVSGDLIETKNFGSEVIGAAPTRINATYRTPSDTKSLQVCYRVDKAANTTLIDMTLEQVSNSSYSEKPKIIINNESYSYHGSLSDGEAISFNLSEYEEMNSTLKISVDGSRVIMWRIEETGEVFVRNAPFSESSGGITLGKPRSATNNKIFITPVMRMDNLIRLGDIPTAVESDGKQYIEPTANVSNKVLEILNMSILPFSSTLNITIINFTINYKKWNEQSSNTSLITYHRICNNLINSDIQVKVNNELWNTFQSDSLGCFNFTYDEEYSEAAFEAESEPINTEELSFVLWSDPHHGGVNPNLTWVIKAVDQINEEDVDFAANLGDLVWNSSEALAEYQEYAGTKLMVPHFILSGNHDVETTKSDRLRTPTTISELWFNETGFPEYYALCKDNILFLFAGDFEEAAIHFTDRERAWVEYMLEKNSDKTVVIFSHQAIYNTTTRSHWRARAMARGGYYAHSSGKWWEDILNRYDNIIIFAHGHNHDDSDEEDAIVDKSNLTYVAVDGYDKEGYWIRKLSINKSGFIIKTWEVDQEKYNESLTYSKSIPTSFNSSVDPWFSYSIWIDNNETFTLQNHVYPESRKLEIIGGNITHLNYDPEIEVYDRFSHNPNNRRLWYYPDIGRWLDWNWVNDSYTAFNGTFDNSKDMQTFGTDFFSLQPNTQYNVTIEARANRSVQDNNWKIILRFKNSADKYIGYIMHYFDLSPSFQTSSFVATSPKDTASGKILIYSRQNETTYEYKTIKIEPVKAAEKTENVNLTINDGSYTAQLLNVGESVDYDIPLPNSLDNFTIKIGGNRVAQMRLIYNNPKFFFRNSIASIYENNFNQSYTSSKYTNTSVILPFFKSNKLISIENISTTINSKNHQWIKTDKLLQNKEIKLINMSVTPSSGILNITIIKFATNYKQWNESSSNASLITDHRICNNPSNSSIQVKVNSEMWNTFLSDSSGCINFTYAGGYSENRFEVEFLPYTSCFNCSDCENNINNAYSGDTVKLNQSITQPVDSTCILWQNNNITFDCQGHEITFTGTDKIGLAGIRLDGHDIDNNTIKNCKIKGFYGGISIRKGDNNTLQNNELKENNFGIRMWNADDTRLDDNIACNNSNMDIKRVRGSGTGDNNTCDNAEGWNDTGTTGCTYYCSLITQT